MLGRRDSSAIQREAWRRSLLACGVDDAELTGFALEVFAVEERASHRLYDDAQGLLDGLAGTYGLALITNGARESQREKLHAVGISDAFDAVVISAEVGFAKPDRRIFQHALDRLGVSASEAWHIGDSLANDVAGARAIGVRAIWLNRHGTVRTAAAPEPDVEIQGLRELLHLLA